jgi:hypothetical protein
MVVHFSPPATSLSLSGGRSIQSSAHVPVTCGATLTVGHRCQQARAGSDRGPSRLPGRAGPPGYEGFSGRPSSRVELV